MNGLSRVHIILDYFDKWLCSCINGLHYVEDNEYV